MANIIEAVRGLDVRRGSSSAAQLIDALAKLHLRQFQRRVDRYQKSNDQAEVKRLHREISQELFGA
jgi:hypothetical protein